jgi:hypothetical protein
VNSTSKKELAQSVVFLQFNNFFVSLQANFMEKEGKNEKV